MEQTIVLLTASGDLVLIYNDGRVISIEPNGEFLELEADRIGTGHALRAS